MMTKQIIRREFMQVMADLPEMCASRLPTTGETILIKRGSMGYWQGGNINAEDFNRHHSITEAQAEAMLAGSMFGWDCPGADPLNYVGDGSADRRDINKRK